MVTGSLGLIGIETCLYFLKKGISVIGIDNNMRKFFFGEDGDNSNKLSLLRNYNNYFHYDINLLDYEAINNLLKENIHNIDCIIHTAAQPSHDWAKKDVFMDWNNNATLTLNLLENVRKYNIDCTFIYTSTNKVYGDIVNFLDFQEEEKRYDLKKDYKEYNGINESMSIDNTMHSLFGVSKLSADLLVQEYGKYFKLKTACFRCGCITGDKHTGTAEHGFLSYLTKIYKQNDIYEIYGYKGKQVRDNLHANDLANAFYLFYSDNKKDSNIYNIGGGRDNSISILEIIDILNLKTKYNKVNREGDHIWWITDNSKFINEYGWEIKYDLKKIINDLI
jgi:CDP-paratose 2-epimerase